MKREIFNSRNLLLVMISALALIFRVLSIEHMFGAYITISSAFILIIYSLYGVKKSVLVSLIVYILSTAIGHSYLDIYILIECLTLGVIDKYRPELNLILKDMLFWIFIAGPIRILMNEVGLVDLNEDYVMFILVKQLINPMMNVLIVDLIVTYSPIKKLIGNKPKVLLKSFLVHIIVIVIFIPFAFNFMTRTRINKEILNGSDIDILNEEDRKVKSVIDNSVYRQSITQFRFTICFSIIVIITVAILYKKVFFNITKLAEVAKEIESDINLIDYIQWPDSNVYEIAILSDNYKKVALKFKEKLTESKNLNMKLEEKSIQLVESQEKLHEIAYFDVLTKLPNRINFMEYLRSQQEKKINEIIAIEYFDINNFKNINDTLGHYIGDEILKEVANRVKNIVTEDILIFRIGGDEFVAMAKVKDKSEAEKVANQIINSIKDSFIIGQRSHMTITISIGISIYPIDNDDLEEVIKFADMAMYKSKKISGNSIEFFDEKVREEFVNKVK